MMNNYIWVKFFNKLPQKVAFEEVSRKYNIVNSM